MDVVLGVSVSGGTARLSIVGGQAADGDVIGQVAVPIQATDSAQIIAEVAKMIFSVRTVQVLQGNRLVAIGLCWDVDAAATLTVAQLKRLGIANIAVIERSVAAAGLVRASSRAVGRTADQQSGLLLVTRDTATLFLVDGESIETVGTHPLAGHTVPACAVLLGELAPDTVDAVYLVGDDADLVAQAENIRNAATLEVVIPDAPEFTVARGTALAAASVVEAPAPNTDPSAGLAALLAAAAARRAQAQPKPTAGRGVTIANFSTAGTGGAPPRYSDVTVRLQLQPPKPKAVQAQTATDTEEVAAPAAVKPTKTPPAREGRGRRPLMLVGSALSALAVAGVAAVAITADQSPIEGSQVQSPVDPAPAAVEANQQVNPEAQVIVPPPPAFVEVPLPEAVLEPAPVEGAPAPEFVDVGAPEFVEVVPEPPVVEPVPEAPVVEPVPEVVAPAPEVVAPAPAAETPVPELAPAAEHAPGGTPPGPGPGPVVPVIVGG